MFITFFITYDRNLLAVSEKRLDLSRWRLKFLPKNSAVLLGTSYYSTCHTDRVIKAQVVIGRGV